jgi:YesN/AraC family two-component response regulator
LLAGTADSKSLEAQLVTLAGRAAHECRLLLARHSPRATIPELRNYVDTRLDGDLTIAALARHLHLNAKYLGELFKQSTGESLGDFVIRARIKRACELLASSDLKVYAIAEQVGYRDAKHFATMFRSVTGLSPVEYREQRRRQAEAAENS